MSTGFVLLVLIGTLVALGLMEYVIHVRCLHSIPIRIHINGTRGKSSVARLIAAGLREGGIKAFAKTTGTLPRMIMADGREYPIYRPSRANIIEQVRIVSLAAREKAQALVIECMALQPRLQALTEFKMVRATHGVITNARADHLDVMGPDKTDVAKALLGTTPRGAKLYTCEREFDLMFSQVCKDRDSELLIVSDEEIAQVVDEELERFSYVEHRENVALALKVCSDLGVERERALNGMWKAQPDLGAMREYTISFYGRELVFVNGFAANDPESTEQIWEMALKRHGDRERKIMIINLREDRPDRSKQLGEALPNWPRAYRYVLVGSGAYILVRSAVDRGLDPSLVINAEGYPVDRIFEEILSQSGRSAMVMGVGNIASPGMDLVVHFRNRAVPENG